MYRQQSVDSRRDDVSVPCRLAVIGGGGVGKTALIRRFLDRTFSRRLSPTLADTFSAVVPFPNGVSRRVEIADTAGTYKFPAERRAVLRSHDTCLLVCSAQDTESLQEASAILQEIDNIKGSRKEMRIIVCLCKTDLAGEDHLKVMTLTQKQLGIVPFCVSAKNGLNVDETFYTALWPAGNTILKSPWKLSFKTKSRRKSAPGSSSPSNLTKSSNNRRLSLPVFLSSNGRCGE